MSIKTRLESSYILQSPVANLDPHHVLRKHTQWSADMVRTGAIGMGQTIKKKDIQNTKERDHPYINGSTDLKKYQNSLTSQTC